MKKTEEKCSNRRDGSVWLEKPRPHRDGEPGEARERHSSRLISVLAFIFADLFLLHNLEE